MYQERLQQFECDHCRELIPKSQPVTFHKNKHFCSAKCCIDFEELEEYDREREYIAALGED